MKFEELIGRLVLFKFASEIRHDLSLFQIFKDELWAEVTGVEQEGVWIQNPSYEMGVWWSEDGKMVPRDHQKKEKFKTNVFIPWTYIRGLMSVDDERFRKVKSDKLPGFQNYQ